MARHSNRDDSGKFSPDDDILRPTHYAPDDIPLSGKIEHAPLDGVPWGDREVGPGWEEVENPDVKYTR